MVKKKWRSSVSNTNKKAMAGGVGNAGGKGFSEQLAGLKLKLFNIAAMPKSSFIAAYSGTLGDDAGKFYDTAAYYANYIAHLFRSGASGAIVQQSPDIAYYAGENGNDQPLAAVSYNNLFPQDSHTAVCKPTDIKAQESPVAYLVDLYQFITGLSAENEAVTAAIEALFSNKRRGDIKTLTLSEETANQVIPGLEVVNTILKKAISAYLADKLKAANQTLEEFLSHTYYPYTLPFHLPALQIFQYLKEKKLELGTLIHQSDIYYPYYIDDYLGIKSNKQKDGLLAYSQLTPSQIYALTSHSLHTTKTNVNVTPGNKATAGRWLAVDEQSITVNVKANLITGQAQPQILEVVAELNFSYKKSVQYHVSTEFACYYNDQNVSSKRLAFPQTASKMTFRIPYQSGKRLLCLFGEILPGEAYPDLFERLNPDSGKSIYQHTFLIEFTNTTLDTVTDINGDYGLIEGTTEAQLITALSSVATFLEKTSLTREQLSQLLSVNQYEPHGSQNVSTILKVTPSVYGSNYVNHGGEPLTITGTGSAESIKGLTAIRLKGLSRFIRLQKWTGLKFDELDWLMTATRNTANLVGEEKSASYFSEEQAIRALGLFNHLHKQYHLELEEFTALIDKLCPYSVGDKLSQFDRLFNNQLKLDGGDITLGSSGSLDPQTTETLHQIAAGIGSDYATLLALCIFVQTAQVKITKTLETVSFFYRIVKLGQLFGFSGLTLWQLLSLILGASAFAKSQPNVIKRFLFPEDIVNKKQTIPDIIDIIVALEECAAWLKAQQVSPANLIGLLTAKPSQFLVETAQISNFLTELSLQFPALESTKSQEALEATFKEAVIKCIVKFYEVSSRVATYLVQLLGDEFLTVITKAAKENLPTETASAVPEYEENVATKMYAGVKKPTDSIVLAYMSNLGQAVAIVNLLKLTTMDLQLMAARPQDFSWKPEERGLFNLKQLYLVTRLNKGLRSSSDTGKTLLDYFVLADSPSSAADYVEKCSELLAQLIDWDKQEISVLFARLHGKASPTTDAPPSPKVASTVADIDWILRIKVLCQQTGLPASQLLNLTALHVDSSYEDYLNAANALRATQVQEVTAK
jgi:hypothetical protein